MNKMQSRPHISSRPPGLDQYVSQLQGSSYLNQQYIPMTDSSLLQNSQPNTIISSQSAQVRQGLAQILKTDCSDEIKHDAVNIVSVGFLRYQENGQRAIYIKNEFERLYGKNYCVLIYVKGYGGWSMAAKKKSFLLI